MGETTYPPPPMHLEQEEEAEEVHHDSLEGLSAGLPPAACRHQQITHTSAKQKALPPLAPPPPCWRPAGRSFSHTSRCPLSSPVVHNQRERHGKPSSGHSPTPSCLSQLAQPSSSPPWPRRSSLIQARCSCHVPLAAHGKSVPERSSSTAMLVTFLRHFGHKQGSQ